MKRDSLSCAALLVCTMFRITPRKTDQFGCLQPTKLLGCNAQVVRTRNSASIYPPLTIMNLVNALLWTAYGFVSVVGSAEAAEMPTAP